MGSAQESPGHPEPDVDPWGSADGSARRPWGSPPPPSTPYRPAPYPSAPHSGAPGPAGPFPAQVPTDRAARNWATGAHLSGFVAAWFALGFLGPLIVLLAAGNTSPFVRRHAVEALNFNLSALVYLLASVVLMLVLIGFLTLPAVGLLYLVATIRGAMAASDGRDYRYPLTIRFVS